MKEKRGVDKKRDIIQHYLQVLMEQEPALYYAATSDVAREIHKQIQYHLKQLDFEDQTLVKNMSARDIEILLSLK